MVPRHHIAPPNRPRCHRDMLKTEVQHIRGRQPAFEIDRDIGQGRDLARAVIRDPAPGGQARKGAFAADPPAQRLARLGQGHLIAALAQNQRRLQPGGAAADDQHPVTFPARGDPFWVPALAPFLHEGGVLGAAADRTGHIAGHADVAADAFADIFEPALFDLLRQERVGDRGARGPDEIQHAFAHLPHHRIGRGEAAHADDRFRGQRLDTAHQRLLRALVLEARGTRTGVPCALRQIPQVGQVCLHLDELAHLGIGKA